MTAWGCGWIDFNDAEQLRSNGDSDKGYGDSIWRQAEREPSNPPYYPEFDPAMPEYIAATTNYDESIRLYIEANEHFEYASRMFQEAEDVYNGNIGL